MQWELIKKEILEKLRKMIWKELFGAMRLDCNLLFGGLFWVWWGGGGGVGVFRKDAHRAIP